MGVSGQRHASTALYPREEDPRYPLDRRLGLDTEARGRGSNLTIIHLSGSKKLGKVNFKLLFLLFSLLWQKGTRQLILYGIVTI
jgi:hypothetical protein